MKPQGYVLKLLTAGCRVFIPFVCKRCGECCRKVGVHPRAIDVIAVAEYLDISVEEVIEDYMGKVISRDEEKIEYEASIRRPCPFLKGNECLIYPVRPGQCKAFPVGTDCGDRGIGCPGNKEAMRAWRTLGRGIPYSVKPILRFGAEVSHIPPEKWDKILAKYRRSHPSKEALELFIKFNRPSLQP